MKSHLNQPSFERTEKEIDELLQQLQYSASEKSISSEDKFFDELVVMLQKTDEPVKEYNATQDDECAEEDLFDQIISDIPDDQLPPAHHFNNMNQSEISDEIAEIESELESIYKKNLFKHKMRDEFMSQKYIDNQLKKRSGMETQNKSDNERIEHHYSMIKLLVNQLSIFSPARKTYMRIIKNSALDHYGKAQQLIETAQRIIVERQGRKTGFFQRHLGKKAQLVHEAIARVDINCEVQLAKAKCN